MAAFIVGAARLPVNPTDEAPTQVLRARIAHAYATLPAAQAWRRSVALCAAAGMP